MDAERFKADVAKLVSNVRKQGELMHHDLSFMNDADIVGLWYVTMLQTGNSGIHAHMAILKAAMELLEATAVKLPPMPELNDADRK